MNIVQLIRTPKTQLGIFLTIIFLSALFKTPSVKIIELFVVSTLFAVLFDLLFLKIRKVPFFFPRAALVTGTIIALLTAPDLPLYDPILAAALAMFSKNFLRFPRHIFNPAAFGLLVADLIFRHSISWWGVSFQSFSFAQDKQFFAFISSLILLTPFYISTIRLKRYRIQVSFLITLLILNRILNANFLILNSLLDPTILFFTAVMLPEPMTTPNRHIQQIVFGSIVAFLSIALSLPFFYNNQLGFNVIVDPFILALLIGNIIFFKFR